MGIRELTDRRSADTRRVPELNTGSADRTLQDPQVGDGVNSFTADFYLEQWVVRATLTTPEARLSEHLNSSTQSLEIWPVDVERGNGDTLDLGGSFAQLNKARLLFVVPLSEPEHARGAGNIAWQRTTAHQCLVGIGPYTVSGNIHVEHGRHPIIGMRLLDKQFIPVTEATLTYPHGTKCAYDAIIVNRAYLDMMVLGNPRWGKYLPS
jgi:hypothetical protein